MSKYVKNLVTDHLRQRLQSVNDALLVNMVGLDANANHRLRTELRAKNIHVLVVKNSLAARATAGHAAGADVRRRGRLGGGLLGQRGHRQPGQGDHAGPARTSSIPPFQPRGGVMDGEQLTPEQVVAGDQVAQPDRAIEPAGRPDPRPGGQAGQPVALGRRRRWPARSPSGARARRKADGRPPPKRPVRAAQPQSRQPRQRPWPGRRRASEPTQPQDRRPRRE